MLHPPTPNTRADPYRGLSVQEVDVPLEASAVEAWLHQREVYRRTEYLVLRNGDRTALVQVRKSSETPLFAPVVESRLLAGPDEVRWIVDPDVDVGNASALAAAASRHASARVLVYVVSGRHGHVNFIWDPTPLRVSVVEVVPPEPAKLYEQARQVVEFDERLPPVRLELDAVDIHDLAAAHPADRYLLPCRASGIDLAAPVAFLDTRPPERLDWLLIGCERSVQLHEHFYGDRPPQVDLCPLRRARARTGGEAPVLTKCCLWERGVECDGGVAAVPWGANLDEVREALRLLAGVDDESRTPVAAREGDR